MASCRRSGSRGRRSGSTWSSRPSPTAPDTDDLGDAVDYGAVADRVAAIAGGGPVDLLEHLADLIARDLLAAFPVERVRVAVHKPQAPLAVPFGDVVVTVERDA